jgi:hypothetical protein
LPGTFNEPNEDFSIFASSAWTSASGEEAGFTAGGDGGVGAELIWRLLAICVCGIPSFLDEYVEYS